MKQILSVLCYFLFIPLFTVSQQVSKPAEIAVVGLIHSGNKHFNHRTLFRVLERAKPDLILWEQSEDFEKVFGLLTANRLRIVRPGIEQLALQKYAKRNKQIRIYGFDTLINSRKQYIKETIRVDDTFYEMLRRADKTTNDSLLYEKFIEIDNAYYPKFLNGSLSEINHPEVYENAALLYRQEQDSILPMAKKYITDTALINDFEKGILFWTLRNDYMVKQILKYAKQYQGKRIVVLTGLNHKYYLVSKLRQEDVPVNLIELDL